MNRPRRFLTKALAIAATGASVWKKPVVDSINLPVHAQTSANYFVNAGQADEFVGEPRQDSPVWTICVSVLDEGSARVTVQGGRNIARRSGVVPLDGSQSDLDEVLFVCDGLPECPVSRVRLTNISAESIVVTHTDGENCGDDQGFIMTVPAGPCGRFEPLNAEECPNR